MRTDVKVGLFLGVAALLLAGWMYWPSAVPSTRTVPVGDLGRPVTVTLDTPQRPAASRTPPTVEPLPTAAAPGPFSPQAAVANVPLRPTEPLAPAAPPLTPSADVPASAAPTASASPEVPGRATIGRSPLLHVVRTGQTLEQIADEYYKQDGKPYDQAAMVNVLRQANPQVAKGKQLPSGRQDPHPRPR